MNKNVVVSINGLQTLDDSEDTVEVITVGEYYNKNGKHYILYEEIDEDSKGVTKNVVKISEESIEIKKKGIVNTTMIFEKDKINKSYYSTPFGDLSVEISTNNIDIEVAETAINIEIQYSLSVNNQHMSNCKISLGVKETGN